MTEEFNQELEQLLTDVVLEAAIEEALGGEAAEEQAPEMVVNPLRGMVEFPHTENPLDLGRKFSVSAVQ